MESVGGNVIETAALGRPFQLGMLYDCRKDALVPGITLWNKETLEQCIRSHLQFSQNFEVVDSDSIEKKSHLLKIDGSLKLSLLGGLINVTGAANYLNDTKKSFIQQRLTLHYHSTTRFEELTMNHLASKNIAHPDVFDHDTATHVVTAVLYGADACFLFDREVSSDEDKTTVEGEVKAVYDKLKFISVDVKANLNMTDVQREAVEKFTVTFYSDFQLPCNPTSYVDAMNVFAKLPKLRKNQSLVVPLRVWLYPLDKLHSKASKLLKEISIDLISDIESALESLNTTEMKCCDLLRDSPALALPAFHNQIKDMKKNCYTYKTRLVEKLGALLPQIRGDQIKDSELTDVLNDYNESPFRERDLSEWLKERERESEVMKTLLRQLKDSGATVEHNLQAILMDLDVRTVVSYTFTSLDLSDVLLAKQKAYLRSSKMENSNDPESKKNLFWLTPAIHKTMRNNLEIFKNLVDSKDRKPAKFIVSSKEMEDQPGSCILLFKDGCVNGVCFTPPSKPAPPITAEVKGDSVIVSVPSSTCPATEELKLLYKMKHEQDWTSQPVMKSQDTVTLTDLRSDAEYEIKCAAVGKLSYTTESDVITVISDSQRASEITRGLAEMLVKDFRPISTVEDTGFVALVKTLEPQYQIPSREQLKETIMQMYNDCKAKVMDILLLKASSVTLMTEMWNLKPTETYLTVSGHFINNWKKQKFVLETISLTSDPKKDDISLELKRITDEWGITDKVILVVTDGADIMISEIHKAGWQQFPCLGLELDKVVMTAIDACSEVSQLLTKCQSIVSVLQENKKIKDLIKPVLEQLTLPENKQIQISEWWDSMFNILEILYRRSEAVNQVLDQLKKKDLCLTKTEISLIQQTLKALGSLKQARQKLLAGKKISLFRVIPILSDFFGATDNQPNAFTRELRNQCQSRFRLLSFMTFLDIRYKSLEYFNKDIIKDVKKYFLSQMQNIHLPSSAPAPPASTSACPSDSQGLSVEHRPFTGNDLETEMCLYENEKAIPADQNPLDWWKNHDKTFPSLSQLAKRYLGIRVATSVLTDRMLGELMRKKRDGLEEDVDIFLFLHQNLQKRS